MISSLHSIRRHLRFPAVRKAFFVLSLFFVVLSTVGAGCSKDVTPPAGVKLLIWRSEDSEDDFADTIAAYIAQYPNVSITYKTLKKDEYEDALVSAWAKGEGPDIFSVPNMRLGKFKEFIAPMPQSVKITRPQTKKTLFGSKTVIDERTVTFIGASRLKDSYVDAVPKDVVFDDQVYGLPLSFDTLTLFYNYDLLARANIAVPPKTMQEFVNAVEAMVVLDKDRKVVQPAAALGTANNVPYFFDILGTIMMQTGATMATDRGQVTFSLEDANKQLPGALALNFYTAFSNPAVKPYTWDDTKPDALESFTAGNLGFYIGYYHDLPVIEQRAPNLNFSFTTFPQTNPDNPVTIASYPVETVFINSPQKEHAWNFIHFAASEEQNRKFTETTGRISARRALISELQRDPILGSYVQQALTAKTWYHGFDPDAAIEAFAEMVDTANQRTMPMEDIVNIGAQKVQLTIEKQ
ncbi:MAG: extracellular solute-binding protein [Candidatus Kerfeldbacteria bacterium]|nr:extracellular solute-binding protein [Candidatus Kerfeldbacteria bacterium]